jgi:hypothetical protein
MWKAKEILANHGRFHRNKEYTAIAKRAEANHVNILEFADFLNKK